MKRFLLLACFVPFVATSAFAKDHVISQKDKKFSVNEIKVKKGDKLLFKNDDTFQHNVYSLSPGNSFELKTQQPGETTPIDIDPAKFKGGEMVIECAIHPTMKLKVTVE